MIIQVLPGCWYLNYNTTNRTKPVTPCLLTNNLDLKGLIWQLYVCMTTQCCFMTLHLCFKKIDIFSWTLWKKVFQMFHMFRPNSWYTILQLIPYRKIFLTIYNTPGPISIYILTNKCPETILRGWLNLKASKSVLW